MRGSEFIQACLDKGMPLDMALKALEAFDAQVPHIMEAALAPIREKARARQEKSRKSRQVTDVTSGHVTERDKRDQPRARVEDIYLTTELSGLAVAVDETRSAPVDDWPDGKADVWSAALVAIVGHPKLDPAKQPGLALTLGRLAAWKRDGASWDHDVVPVVTKMVRQKTGPPVATWKYFDAAIAQSIADNRQALQIPEARRERPDDIRAPKAPDRRGHRTDPNIAGAALALERKRGLRGGSQGPVDEVGSPGAPVVSGGVPALVHRLDA